MRVGRRALAAIHAPWGMGVGWSWLGLMLLIRAAEKPAWEPNAVLTAQWCPWIVKAGWKWSTTIGRAIIYQADSRDDDPTVVDSRLERHERKHIWQGEDMMCLSLVVGAVVFAATGNWALALGLYISGGVWQLPNFVTAGAREGFSFDKMYREAEHERSAYAQTDLCIHLGKSWEELRALGN